MTEKVWHKAFDLLMLNEGGYVNNPHDKGGETKYGISKKTYPDLDIENLSLDEAKSIYRKDYWLKYKCDKLPDALSVALFDFCVQSRPPKPTKFLQQCLGVVDDGIIGKQTIGAAYSRPLKPVIEEYFNKRLAYYQTLSSWEHFKNGWTTRINRTRKFCEELV